MKMNVIDIDELMIRLNEIGERYSEYCSCQAQFNDIMDLINEYIDENSLDEDYDNREIWINRE